MKKRDKYFLVIMMFLMVMVIVLSYFYNRYNNTGLINESKELLGDIYTLKTGTYELRNGTLLDSNGKKINDKEYVKASGFINIDKYQNVRFKLNKDNSCISKTYLGNIKFEKNNCGEFNNITVHMIKNNNNISFETKEQLEYMVSNKDDFKGIWIKQDNNQNIIINSYNEGKNYIWFKDMEGNISKPYTFTISCLDTSNAKYDSGVFYCSGSTVILDDIKWVVLKDNNSSIKLMRFYPLDEKMEYTKLKDEYKWSSSSINSYLNNEFISSLSEELVNKLLTIEICDDYSSYYCNNEICGGREKEEIERNNYICSSYTTSKVKLISYDDFNYAYATSKNKETLKGYYLSLNSLEYGKVSSITYNYDYYILEKVTNKLDIRPVIIVDK